MGIKPFCRFWFEHPAWITFCQFTPLRQQLLQGAAVCRKNPLYQVEDSAMNHIFQASLYIYSFCTVCHLRMSGWCSRERAKEERVWSDHTCILLASLLCSAIILTLMDFITISKICAVHVYKFILQKGLGQCHCHAVFGKKIAGKFELIISFQEKPTVVLLPHFICSWRT